MSDKIKLQEDSVQSIDEANRETVSRMDVSEEDEPSTFVKDYAENAETEGIFQCNYCTTLIIG